MASSELRESSGGHEAVEQKELEGDLSELLEQVEEMYKTFLVGSPSAHVSKDESRESKKPEPWCPRTWERTMQSSLSTTSEHKKADSPQEWQEVIGLKQSVQNILHSKKYKNGDRLSAEDEMKVSTVFQYHPKAELKTGPGIDYLKIDQIHDEFTRCFWVVRVDGTAVDFSFHKCLNAKLARESPHLVEQYESKIRDHLKALDLLRDARRGEKSPST